MHRYSFSKLFNLISTLKLNKIDRFLYRDYLKINIEKLLIYVPIIKQKNCLYLFYFSSQFRCYKFFISISSLLLFVA